MMLNDLCWQHYGFQDHFSKFAGCLYLPPFNFFQFDIIEWSKLNTTKFSAWPIQWHSWQRHCLNSARDLVQSWICVLSSWILNVLLATAWVSSQTPMMWVYRLIGLRNLSLVCREWMGKWGNVELVWTDVQW